MSLEVGAKAHAPGPRFGRHASDVALNPDWIQQHGRANDS
jgi:hypothetical protein